MSLSSSSSASTSLSGRKGTLFAGIFIGRSVSYSVNSDSSKSARLLLSLRFVRKKEFFSGRSGDRGLMSAPLAIRSSVSDETEERGVFDNSSSVVDS